MNYIWGASGGRLDAIRTIADLGMNLCDITCFLDRNPNLWGRHIEGLEVRSPDILCKGDFVIVGSMFSREIYNECQRVGARCVMPNYFGWALFGVSEEEKNAELVFGNLADAHSKKTYKEILKARRSGGYDPYFLTPSLYPQYENPLLNLKPGDVVVEAGGFDGESANLLTKKFGVSVHTFEPEIANFSQLLQNVSENELVYPNNLSLSDGNSKLKVVSNGANSYLKEIDFHDLIEDNSVISSITIDDYATQRSLKVDHIKLDVEGYEIKALDGALGVINKDRPTLSIAIYHQPYDPIDIPMYLIRNLVDYSFYIGHHSQWILESMVYCIPLPQLNED